MGSPGWTSFCKNGHIVQECSHHSIIQDETVCLVCKTEEIRMEVEWGDDDYGPFLVPETPIRWDDTFVTCECGKKVKVGIVPVYDTSKLFEDK